MLSSNCSSIHPAIFTLSQEVSNFDILDIPDFEFIIPFHVHRMDISIMPADFLGAYVSCYSPGNDPNPRPYGGGKGQ
jgi:hypothetical protein